MTERKTIQILVTFNRVQVRKVNIPYDIDEVDLKARLRDLGYISSYRNSYLTTKVYFDTENGDVEIGKDECRSLDIKVNTKITKKGKIIFTNLDTIN